MFGCFLQNNECQRGITNCFCVSWVSSMKWQANHLLQSPFSFYMSWTIFMETFVSFLLARYKKNHHILFPKYILPTWMFSTISIVNQYFKVRSSRNLSNHIDVFALFGAWMFSAANHIFIPMHEKGDLGKMLVGRFLHYYANMGIT